MNYKYLYRGFGVLAFLITLISLLMTAQPSVPFWDCGEFSAASVWQQVCHPPGAPLFLMVGKIFQTLIPFGDPGWRINVLSVVAGAFTIFFLYFVIVKTIQNYRKSPIETLSDALMVFGSAFVGAVAFGYCDTFWFNAVESEVYSSSTLFVAIMLYMMMRWNEEADNPGNERYILFMAYLIGLSTGVHLLSILTVYSIIMLIYFRKYKVTTKSFIIMGIIALLTFFIIYLGVVNWIPPILGGDFPMKNECKRYIIQNTFFVSMLLPLIVVILLFLTWVGYNKKIPMLSLASLSFVLILFGYSTYTQTLIRSNANPPMNENEPKTFDKLASYIGREQYGDAPLWPRRYQTEDYFIAKYEQRNDSTGEYVYGPWNQPDRKTVNCSDEDNPIQLPDFNNVNTGAEIKYMFKYQIYDMYFRYLFWNFVGRSSDVQDADYAFVNKKEAEALNYKSGYAQSFPIRFFALPLLFGLIGMFYHFNKDPKMALVFFVMFLLMGVLAAIAQNQQNPQPRERDYFYAGSFLVYCLWISLGTFGLIEWLIKKKFAPAIAAVLIISFLLVPFNMAWGGWRMHSRAGNYIPFDYSYNILQSTDKDAILFTNGDNDTFPVWFLQDVEGIRRDVRVVNLSLGNTLWYINQLKNREPWGAKKIPLSFSDESLNVDETDTKALSYDFGEPLKVDIEIPKDVMKKFTNDPNQINDNHFRTTFLGKNYGKRDGKPIILYRVQDKLVLDIIKQTKFTRPLYYSTTVGPDAFCGLEKFFRYEGMAMRICPIEQKSSGGETIDYNVMEKSLMNIDNSNNFYTEPRFGFKLRNLNNPSVFYDEVHRRLIPNYRNHYITYAKAYITERKDPKKAIAILDTMNKYISVDQFPMTYDYEYQISRLYHDCGDKAKAEYFGRRSLKSCQDIISNPSLHPEIGYYEIVGRFFGAYRISSLLYEMFGDYANAIEKLKELHERTKMFYTKYKDSQDNQEELQKAMYNMYDLQANIDEFSIVLLDKQGKHKEAIETAKELLNKYNNANNPVLNYFSKYIQKRLNELEGIKDSTVAELP